MNYDSKKTNELFAESLKILEINKNDLQQANKIDILKQAYYKKALKFHPDKFKYKDNGEKFKEIKKAYDFLNEHIKNERGIPKNMFKEKNKDKDYNDILQSFFHMVQSNWDTVFIKSTVNQILFNYKHISEPILKEISLNKLLEMYELFLKYKDVFHLKDDFLLLIKKVIQTKIQSNNIIILNPTMDDLVEGNIYNLNFNGEKYYIPLWHKTMCFDLSGNGLLVKIIPEIPNNVTIDDRNNVFYNIEKKIDEIKDKETVEIPFLNQIFKIYRNELTITSKKQLFIFKKRGIYKINKKNMFDIDIEKRSTVFIHLTIVF